MSNKDKLSALEEENAKLLNLNKQLNLKLQSLENQNATSFIDNISHEMRIPTQAINAISKGLVQNWDSFDRKTNFDLAKKIAGNSGRLVSLIDNLIEIPNIKKGMVDLKFSKISIIELIEELIEECKNFYITGKNIKFKIISKIKRELKILIDPNKITQLLRNIFSNAIKASDKGLITIHVIIEGGNIEISVTDQGSGIPKDQLNQLFNENTTSQKYNKPGVGIGLSIANIIAKAHRGKIRAESILGKGSKVSVTIPISTKSSSNKEIKLQTSGNVNVVVIDDEEACLLSISMMLMKTGYGLQLFSSPLKGIEEITKFPKDADVILLDIMMPELSGIEVLKKLQSSARLKNIPVIMQSGVANMNQIDESLSLGAKDFIRKPYSKETLIKSIENVIKTK